LSPATIVSQRNEPTPRSPHPSAFTSRQCGAWIASSFVTIAPSGSFVVELAGYALLWALLVLWPLVGAAMRRQWGWLILIVFFGPFAGVPWFFLARRASGRLGEVSVRPV
jgi:hypothetical protein